MTEKHLHNFEQGKRSQRYPLTTSAYESAYRLMTQTIDKKEGFVIPVKRELKTKNPALYWYLSNESTKIDEYYDLNSGFFCLSYVYGKSNGGR